MLTALGSICEKENLLSVRPANSNKEVFSLFLYMGVPLVGSASAGRMNPAGISYFYVAYD